MLTDQDKFPKINKPPITKPNMVNLEKKYCNQIFIGGHHLKRDIFKKSVHDVSPKYFYGYKINTRKILILLVLSLFFALSTVATSIMWLTTCFQDAVNSLMIISEDSPTYSMWKTPPPRPFFKFYLFNYTNVEEYENGDAKKLNVQEVGPYVYHEQLERVNIRFHKNGTVSYQEKRFYTFSEELSGGYPEDQVTVPNIALLSGAAVVKDFNIVMRLGYNGLLSQLSERPFFTIDAKSFIEGYETYFTELSKHYLKFQNQKFFEKMGLLGLKQGIQPDVYTVNTGIKNFENFGKIERFNGGEEGDLWSTKECNNYQVSDGMIYSQKAIEKRETLRFYVPQMCRTLPLVFDKEVTLLDGVTASRYRIPMNLYDTPDKNEENRCYCRDKLKEGIVCSPQGVFDASPCISGAPMFFSFPYFYNADPIFRESITGLKEPFTPDVYLDIHSVGLPMSGKLQAQINIQIQKSYGIYSLNKYEDKLMLPVFWVDGGLSDKELGDEITNNINLITFVVPNFELAFKYGSLLGMIVSLACIILVLKRKKESRRTRTDSTRPLRRNY